MKSKYPRVAIQYASRNKRLVSMGYSNYQEYLKSDDWKFIKALIKKRQDSGQQFWLECYVCRVTDRKLIPHHVKYKLKKGLGGIVPVCNSCHFRIHEYNKAHPRSSIGQATKRLRKKWTKKVSPTPTPSFQS